ncbi:MAG: potassium channel protein [Acidimicrobiia bacterium]|nr:potassium channel protein [Acidimicrobiia bacterium]
MDRRLIAGLLLLAAVSIVGTFGYVILGLGVLDAFYMTVITITTVGFREVQEFGAGGKIFTVFILISGMGVALYTAVVGLEYVVETLLGGQRAKRRMLDLAAKMSDHVILVGYGQVGRGVAKRLAEEGAPIVVVESDPDKATRARDDDHIVIEGDGTQDEVLEAAGLQRAKALVAAAYPDSDNLVITMSAKAKRPEVLVVARVVDSQAERKLYMAGADRVVAPQVVGAERLAALALKPDLAEFIDLVVRGTTVEFRVEEMKVEQGSEIVGKSLRELDLRRRAGALVLAVGAAGGQMALNPDPALIFQPGQIIIAIGTTDQLDRLRVITTLG